MVNTFTRMKNSPPKQQKKPSSGLFSFLQYSDKEKWYIALFLHKTIEFWGGPIHKFPVKQATTRLGSQVSHREVPDQKAIKVPFFPSLRNAPKMKSTSKLISFQQNISLLANRRVVTALTKNFWTYRMKSCLSHGTKPSTSQRYRIWSPKRIRWQLDRLGTNIALCVTEIT